MIKCLKSILIGLLAILCLGLTGVLLLSLALTSKNAQGQTASDPAALGGMDRYDMYMTNQISNALDGIFSVKKVYWLHDRDQVAPRPDEKKFGEAETPQTLAWIEETAKDLLDGQSMFFTPNVPIAPNSKVHYYLDETILAISWKQPIGNTMYTFSEVKLAHPSQFRRFLAGGEYGSDIQLLTTEMAESVNAVVASSGDFYRFRRHGVVVYDGQVQRVNSEQVDTCYVDAQGDLLFSYRGELPTMEQAQAFVEENNIRFSLSFGPVLIRDGKIREFSNYLLGEVGGHYARAVLCQQGPLHYLLVTANSDGECRNAPDIWTVQRDLQDYGVQTAYALDGGQTAAVVMNRQLMNRVVYGYQREISDIIYFATAVPDGE